MAIDKITGNGLSSDAVTPAAVSDVANTSTGQFDLPAGTTAQRPGSALTGSQRFNTDLAVMEFYDGTVWKKVSAQIPTLNSVTGNIHVGYGTNLTLSGLNFLTSNLVVNFFQGSDNINTDVTVTPSSDSAATVAVPAAVYNNVTAGNAVTIKVTNSDLAQSGGVNTTALALPTGGTISVVNGYRVHAFTSGANFVIPSGVTISADYLIVAGGGGGGGWGGGGGAGGTQLLTSQSMTAGTYAAVVGTGGSRGSYSTYTPGGDGNDSSFNGTTSTGGGGGGAFTSSASTNQGRNGGSGGGAGIGGQGSNYAGGTGTSGQGNNGGVGGDMEPTSTNYEKGGGGGGKGAVGYSGNWNETSSGNVATLGQGGVGVDYTSQFGSSFGESGFFGGGGGGHTDGRTTTWAAGRCAGGNGGGGNGGTYVNTAGENGFNGARGDDGDANTGGGGGGSYGGTTNGDNTSALTGAGGSGIVLVRYQL